MFDLLGGGIFGSLLFFKTKTLFNRIVEFAVSIGKFACSDEQFETFSDEWVVAIGASQR